MRQQYVRHLFACFQSLWLKTSDGGLITKTRRRAYLPPRNNGVLKRYFITKKTVNAIASVVIISENGYDF